MQKYVYDGPVMIFGRCVASSWYGFTYAVSEKKARCNLEYQFKKQANLTPNSKVELPGKITLSE